MRQFGDLSNVVKNLSGRAKQVKSIKPLAIITYGPSGSGKHFALDLTLQLAKDVKEIHDWCEIIAPSKWPRQAYSLGSEKQIGEAERSNYNLVPVLQDEVIFQFEQYRSFAETVKTRLKLVEESSVIVEDFLKDKDQEEHPCIHPSSLSNRESSSFHSRSLTDLSKECSNEYLSYLPVLHLLTSNLINSSIAKKKNLLIETTGNNLDYLKELFATLKENGYYIVIVYPFAHLKTNIKRVITRARQDGRLVNLETLPHIYMASFNNFFTLLKLANEAFLITNDSSISETNTIVFQTKEGQIEIDKLEQITPILRELEQEGVYLSKSKKFVPT